MADIGRGYGRSLVKVGSRDERARLATYIAHSIREWMSAGDVDRKTAAKTFGVGEAQIAKYLGGQAVPSYEAGSAMLGAGMFAGFGSMHALQEGRPWLAHEPHPRVVAMQDAREERKKAKPSPKAKPAPVQEAAPVPAEDDLPPTIFDAIAQESGLPASAKMALSALTALALHGADIRLDVTARVR